MTSQPNRWLCIDFGTCNTAAAFLVGGKPHLVTYGNSSFFPTVACVLESGEIQVCQNAEPLRDRFAEFFQQEFKLQIADPVDINGRSYQDIIAEILRFVSKAAALENNNQPLDKALITVPAIYTASDPRKEVMRQAAMQAGFTEVEFMPEPHAAACHYAYVTGVKKQGLSLVYDLGGGTFDPVLIDMTGTPQILGEGGVRCGGQFFDAAVYKQIASAMREAGTPLARADKLADYQACRRLKETLSLENTETQIFSNGKSYTLDRATFNELIRPMLRLTLEACDNVVTTAGRKWSDIGQVLFVGGSTAIPLIKDMLEPHLQSHNASGVKVIRTMQGANDSYNHLYATCLGGITTKIGGPQRPPIGHLMQGSRKIQLHEGVNTFGRLNTNDFSFEDKYMSRQHFTIEVLPKGDDYEYILKSVSQSTPTLLNGSEALDPRHVPFCREKAPIFNGASILAGKTLFILETKA